MEIDDDYINQNIVVLLGNVLFNNKFKVNYNIKCEC